MTTDHFNGLTVRIDDLPSVIGETFGPSSWRTISQSDVDRYAELSEDRNPIHIDPIAAAATPFGTTIAHGYLTLGLVVPLMAEVFDVTGISMGINYGINRLRFPAPVPVGSRVRVTGIVESVTEMAGGFQVEPTVKFEIEGGSKPACVAEIVLRYYR